MNPIEPEKIEIEVARGGADSLPFYCVSPAKLSILSFATIGLYELYWFYRNWALIRARSGRDISPFWRGVFAIFYCHALATTVDSAAKSVNVPERLRPGLVAAGYAALLVTQRLPDPWWLVCLFSFVPLIPIAVQIRRVHEAMRPGFEGMVGWGGWSLATLAVGGAFTSLLVAVSFGPPTRALRESEIPSRYQATLEEAGVLEPGEQIRFLYAGGLFSLMEDGNLLTGTRVISYWTADGELYVSQAAYPEIRAVAVEYSEDVLDDTVITVSTQGDEEFVLIVAPEDGRDREFVSALEASTGLRSTTPSR
jgi:hypothetical protein